jgi:hypothetical protein
MLSVSVPAIAAGKGGGGAAVERKSYGDSPHKVRSGDISLDSGGKLLLASNRIHKPR